MEKKSSVLIADDEADNILVLRSILHHDYTVYAAKDGQTALIAAEKHIPDVILLDVIMPGMDGYEVIAALKQNEKTKDIPVIFITGLVNNEDEKKGLTAGAVDYITKPFSPSIVKLRLQAQINMLKHIRTINRQLDSIKSIEYENVINMLSSTPHTCHLWNRKMEMLDCNDASLELFKVGSKEDFFTRFFEFSPEIQPNGKLSSEMAMEGLQNAFRTGKGIFDWMHIAADGESIPCEMTLVRITLQSDDYVVAYTKDLREHNAMKAEIRLQDNLLYTVSSVAGILLQSSEEDFTEDMYICMGMMAEAVAADRVYIWKNHMKGEELYCTQIYEWSEGAEPQQNNDLTVDIPYSAIPEWEGILSNGMCINSMVKDMGPGSRAQLEPQGILSIFVTPVFLRDQFWGFIGFDDCRTERVFSDNEEMILRSAGLLIANAMLKNEMTVNLKSSAMQLEEALGEAQEANKAKSAFLSNMSHEIRTPMNAITGMGELLLHERLNERQKGYVNDIVVSSKALLEIINDILDFSKIESGKLELNPVDYDFKAFIENIESMFLFIAQKKKLEFRLECGEGLPGYLYGDDLRLRQTLTNIIGNAVKFTEKGYVQLKIAASNDTLTFEVKDTGIGIREDDMPKLFSAFEQVDKSKNRNVVGTGLGLAISKSFVEMMGGNITLKSKYGHGTVFTIIIPAVLGSRERIEHRLSAQDNHTVSAPNANILVVDDNEFNLKVAGGLLNLCDIEAETVDSGAKALVLIGQKDYDIVFMDHMMPEMDGMEATALIRKMGGKQKHLPIVALTANAVHGAREMFLANGFNDFISKPIDSHELVRVLEIWLPPEKIVSKTDPEAGHTRSDKEDKLRRKSILTFVKGNRDTFEKMTQTLYSGDFKTAHRIAHTLKSSAGYLGKKELSAAAASLEASLQAQPPGCTSEQLNTLGELLASALLEFEPLINEAETEKHNAVEIGVDKLTALLSEIKPLLEKGDFGASDYVEKLQRVTGMEELAEKIDDYDFEGALLIVNNIL